MQALRRIIWSTLAVLALSPAGAFAAGSGSTAERHQMSMYKVEHDMSLDAVDIGTTSLTCPKGDLAIDGMWRVTYTDFNPQLDDEAPAGGWNDYNGIDVWDSHSVGQSAWRFTVYNETSETAQVKLWVTCLNRKVQPADRDAHRHKLVLGPLQTAEHSFGGTAPAEFQAAGYECPAGTMVVAPGFWVTKGGVRVYESVPTDDDLTAWEFGFYPQEPSKVETSVRCLQLASTDDGAPSHHHNLVVRLRDTDIALTPNLVNRPVQHCGELEKGLLGLFDVRLANPWTAPYSGHHLWFLGMEPQIKSRVFKVWNTDAVTSWTARFGAVCVNDRIGRRVLA